MSRSTVHDTAARGFSRARAEYERGRPGYPEQAVSLLADELGIGPGRTVVDLAAGTGKLTRSLVRMGADVRAVEPLAGMREQLVESVPGAAVLDGTAEALPLDDASVDVIVVAQALHWFDTAVAAAEINRVLRPDGGLGVIWNAWDESTPWVARLQELVHAYVGQTPQHATSPWQRELAATGLFTPLRERHFPHLVQGDLEALLARVSSVSYIATLDQHERQHVLAQVRELISADPQTRGRAEFGTPYVTHAAWCHPAPRAGAPSPA